jgi:hypothetical protein
VPTGPDERQAWSIAFDRGGEWLSTKAWKPPLSERPGGSYAHEAHVVMLRVVRSRPSAGWRPWGRRRAGVGRRWPHMAAVLAPLWDTHAVASFKIIPRGQKNRNRLFCANDLYNSATNS